MKAITNNTTPANLAVSDVNAALAPTQELDRPLALIAQDFEFREDGRAVLRKGAKPSEAEVAWLIADREQTGAKFKTQARWLYFEATAIGKEYAETVKKGLAGYMSASALNQLTSEARTLCPIVIEHGFKTPLSLLKDAVAGLRDEKGNIVIPPKSKRKGLAKELVPLLENGGITQAGIRELRKKHEAPAAAAPAKPSATKSPLTKEEQASLAVVLKLNDVAGALDGVRMEGDDRQKAVVILTDICRKMGLTLSEVGAKMEPVGGKPTLSPATPAGKGGPSAISESAALIAKK